MALNLILLLAKEKGIINLHICGDSKSVINWMNGSSRLHKYSLRLIFSEIQRLKNYFLLIDYSHVYMKQNQEADVLSKSGL